MTSATPQPSAPRASITFARDSCHQLVSSQIGSTGTSTRWCANLVQPVVGNSEFAFCVIPIAIATLLSCPSIDFSTGDTIRCNPTLHLCGLQSAQQVPWRHPPSVQSNAPNSWLFVSSSMSKAIGSSTSEKLLCVRSVLFLPGTDRIEFIIQVMEAVRSIASAFSAGNVFLKGSPYVTVVQELDSTFVRSPHSDACELPTQEIRVFSRSVSCYPP